MTRSNQVVSATISREADSAARRLVDGRLRERLHVLLFAELTLVALMAAMVWHSRTPDRIDANVAKALYARPGTLPRSIADMITTIGKPGVVVAASFVVAVLAWRRFRAVHLALFCPAAVGVTSLLGHALKLLVERPRPATAALAHELDFSYPSGHATGATALAVAIILLAALAGPRWRSLVTVTACMYAAAISVSRLVIGVHYLADVVAAVLVGTAGVLAAGWLWSQTSTELGAATPSPHAKAKAPPRW